MAISSADRLAQLRQEERHLAKAKSDIFDGKRRLLEQGDRVRELRAGGHDTGQAERLVELLMRILAEWERHRELIEQRILYLQEQAGPPS